VSLLLTGRTSHCRVSNDTREASRSLHVPRAPASRRALGREKPEGASGNLFRAQFPERRGGSSWAARAPRTPNRAALPAWWRSAPPATRQTIKGVPPALATQLPFLHLIMTTCVPSRGRSPPPPALVSVVPLSGDGPRLFPRLRGRSPVAGRRRVAIFPTSAFMEMKTCVPAEYA
jgi:hypothetical protein